MPRTIVLVVFIMFGATLQAQLPVLYSENFSNNQQRWYEANNNDIKANVSDGKYYVHIKGDFFWRSTQSVNINPTKDFRINLTIRQLSGKTDYGHGLMWASDDWDNIFVFVVAETYFKIDMYKAGKHYPIKTWTNSAAIHTTGQTNVLTVSSKKNTWHFFVNGTWVHSIKNEPFMGMQQGAVYMDKAEYELLKLEVRQEKPGIKTAGITDTGIQKENMGENINTAFDEIAPIVSADGNTLFWGQDQLPDTAFKSNFDVFFSHRNPDGTWQKAQRMPAPINNEADNIVVAVSTNLDALILEGQYGPGGAHVSDDGISISYRTQTGQWSVPQQIPIDDFYNRNEFMSFCLSPDRTVLIMSVQRDDGLGSKDLYVSFLKPDSSYTSPKNMGNVLNNWHDEGTPFLAPDLKTLYFYSYTYPGYGRADIFVSKRLDESWTNWSEPLNLGDAINTPDWDTYYTVSATGDYAFFTSASNTIGESDIFRIKLNQQNAPDNMLMLTGKVLDSDTRQPLFASIVYKNKNSGKVVKTIQSDPATGEYKILLEPQTEYLIKAQANGYMAFNQTFGAAAVSRYTEQYLDLLLSPLKTGTRLIIPNLFFVQSQAEILPESVQALDELLDVMLQHPAMEIILVGHTENRGDPALLRTLSEQRAETVRQYLIAHGIAPGRIQTLGKGASQPLNDNATEEERALNRRVEIIIVSNP